MTNKKKYKVLTTMAETIYEKAERLRMATLVKNFPYWGWGVHEGLRCARSDNTGCNTYWKDGKLYAK